MQDGISEFEDLLAEDLLAELNEASSAATISIGSQQPLPERSEPKAGETLDAFWTRCLENLDSSDNAQTAKDMQMALTLRNALTKSMLVPELDHIRPPSSNDNSEIQFLNHQLRSSVEATVRVPGPAAGQLYAGDPDTFPGYAMLKLNCSPKEGQHPQATIALWCMVKLRVAFTDWPVKPVKKDEHFYYLVPKVSIVTQVFEARKSSKANATKRKKMASASDSSTSSASAHAGLSSSDCDPVERPADLAVARDLSVGRNCSVSGDASVGGAAQIGGDATVGGDANIRGNMRVGRDAVVGGNLAVVGDMDVDGCVRGRFESTSADVRQATLPHAIDRTDPQPCVCPSYSHTLPCRWILARAPHSLPSGTSALMRTSPSAKATSSVCTGIRSAARRPNWAVE